MKILVWICAASCLLLFLPAQAQIVTTAYHEIGMENRSDIVPHSFSLKEKGVMMMHPSSEPIKNGQKKVRFSHYDTALVLKWEKDFFLPHDEEVWGTVPSDSLFCIMMHRRVDEYRLLSITLDSGNMTFSLMPEIKNLQLSHAKRQGDKLVIAGQVDIYPVVLLASLRDSVAPVALASISTLRATVIDVVADSVQPYFYVLLDKKKPISEPGIYVNKYDWNGRMIQGHDVRLSREYSLITHQPVMSEDGNIVLFGTYTLGPSQDTQGLYSMNIEQGQITSNRFYDFGYLKNFFNYLPQKQREKKIKRIQKLLENDKRMYHRYRVVMHPLIEHPNRFIMMGDVVDMNYQRNDWANYPYNPAFYNPRMTSAYYRYWSQLYNPWGDWPSTGAYANQNQPSVTEYKHSFVLGFNKEGKLLWDNSFVYEETELPYLTEGSQVYVQQDTCLIVQFKEEEEAGKVYYMKAYQSQNDTATSIKAHTVVQLEPGQREEYHPLEHWAGPHFLLTGKRKARDDDEKKQMTFFLRRLTAVVPKK